MSSDDKIRNGFRKLGPAIISEMISEYGQRLGLKALADLGLVGQDAEDFLAREVAIGREVLEEFAAGRPEPALLGINQLSIDLAVKTLSRESLKQLLACPEETAIETCMEGLGVSREEALPLVEYATARMKAKLEAWTETDAQALVDEVDLGLPVWGKQP